MSFVCGLEVAKTGSLAVMGTANPYLWTEFGPKTWKKQGLICENTALDEDF